MGVHVWCIVYSSIKWLDPHYLLMTLSRPPSVERVHQELLQFLIAVRRLPGKTGTCAEEVAKYLQPHLDREDECELPLLGLLQDLAAGTLTLAVARQGSKVYARLKEEYPRMSAEHRELFKLIEQLKTAGMEEGHLTAVRFAETMERHAQDEEELLYPAALLAGRLASERAEPRSARSIRS